MREAGSSRNICTVAFVVVASVQNILFKNLCRLLESELCFVLLFIAATVLIPLWCTIQIIDYAHGPFVARTRTWKMRANFGIVGALQAASALCMVASTPYISGVRQVLLNELRIPALVLCALAFRDLRQALSCMQLFAAIIVVAGVFLDTILTTPRASLEGEEYHSSTNWLLWEICFASGPVLLSASSLFQEAWAFKNQDHGPFNGPVCLLQLLMWAALSQFLVLVVVLFFTDLIPGVLEKSLVSQIYDGTGCIVASTAFQYRIGCQTTPFLWLRSGGISEAGFTAMGYSATLFIASALQATLVRVGNALRTVWAITLVGPLTIFMVEMSKLEDPPHGSLWNRVGVLATFFGISLYRLGEKRFQPDEAGTDSPVISLATFDLGSMSPHRWRRTASRDSTASRQRPKSDGVIPATSDVRHRTRQILIQ